MDECLTGFKLLVDINDDFTSCPFRWVNGTADSIRPDEVCLFASVTTYSRSAYIITRVRGKPISAVAV